MKNSLRFTIGFDFNSILIYLLFFFISFFFCYISEKMFKSKKRKKGFFSALISILILSLLSSLRSTEVGFDINVYLLPNFEHAIFYDNFKDFYIVASKQMEFLFSLLVYGFAKIKNLNLLFFTIQLLVLIPVYFTLYRNREKCSITVAYIIYIFLFYNFSLSGMRQAIAMSFAYLAIDYLMDKKYLKFILLGIIAFLFHKGVSIPLVLLTIILFFENKKLYKCLLMITANTLIIFFIFYNQFSYLLSKVFYSINPRYSYYISTYLSNDVQWNNIPTTEVILKSSIIFCCILFGHYRNKNNNRNVSILTMALLGRYFVLLNARMYEALRVAYYFDMFGITLVGNTVWQLKKKSSRRVLSFFLIIFAFLYWIYFIMYIGGYKTNIYIFA